MDSFFAACGLLIEHADVLMWLLNGATPPKVNADEKPGRASATAAPATRDEVFIITVPEAFMIAADKWSVWTFFVIFSANGGHAELEAVACYGYYWGQSYSTQEKEH
jgi:hypothetical protein